MRTSIVTLTFLFAFQTLIFAQGLIEQLDAVFEKSLKEWGVPGMAVGIVKDGKVILAKGYGVLEAGRNESPNSATMFAIASNTKAFTTTALATLVEEGKLSWNSKVREFIPNYQLYDSYTSNHVTVRDILSHRVGYGNYSGDAIWYKSNRSAAELMERIKYVPKAFDFRAGFGYSNLMYMTAGEVINSITNMKWDDYIKSRFLKPLGMDRTITSVNELTMFSNVATPHKPIEDENMPISWTNWDNMSSAGAIISNVDDMLKWCVLHLNHGEVNGKTYFSQDIQEELWHPHNSQSVDQHRRELYPTNFSAFGLGFMLYDFEGEKVISHGGAYDGMYSRVTMVPGHNLGIVFLTNSMKPISDYLTYDMLAYFLDGNKKDWQAIGLENHQNYVSEITAKKDAIRSKRVEGTQPTVNKSELIGTYYDNLYGKDIKVTSDKNNKLNLIFEGAPGLSANLEHWHYNTYEIKWNENHAWFDFGTLDFVTDNNNEVIRIEFDVPNGDIFFYEIEAKKQD